MLWEPLPNMISAVTSCSMGWIQCTDPWEKSFSKLYNAHIWEVWQHNNVYLYLRWIRNSIISDEFQCWVLSTNRYEITYTPLMMHGFVHVIDGVSYESPLSKMLGCVTITFPICITRKGQPTCRILSCPIGQASCGGWGAAHYDLIYIAYSFMSLE